MLMVYKDGQFVEQRQAKQFPFVIGRSNANDLVIIDKEVSRRHAIIDCIGGIYVVEDLNSKNGIMVNRKPRPRSLLRSGDVMTFGQIDVVFYTDRAAGKDKPALVTTAVHKALPEDEHESSDQTGETSRQRTPEIAKAKT